MNAYTSGLVAHYEFENNANDTSGKANHGNEIGGIKYVSGVIGQAASFDGVDDTIKIEHNDDIDFNIDDSYSIGIYIKYTENPINDDSSILEKWGDILPSPYPMVLRTTKSDVHFAIHDHYDGGRAIVDITSVDRKIASPNLWHHIVITKNANQYIKMYVNGILVSTDSDIEVKNISSINPLYIGSRGNDSNSYATPLWYQGLVDDLRIYNRALSEFEVKALYQLGGGSGATGKLNDTGITKCADNDQNNLPCPQAGFAGQDAEFGRDANQATNNDTDGHAGFSFTKISSTGAELPSTATEWSCVKDNVTGLMWEVKTDDGGLHDKDWTYTWYEPDNTKNGGNVGTQNGGSCGGTSQCDTYGFVQAVNAAGWCGAKDWRIPAVDELSGIAALDRSYPAIDTAFFSNTTATVFWSASPHVGYGDLAWLVNFYDGGDGWYPKSVAFQVRLVRSGQ